MNFSEDELELFRQWFNAVEDLNPKYLERKDYLLAKKVLDELGAKTPNSMLEKLEKLSS
ncbi:hypothetical protein [Pseudomonas aeruginosa]|uniref:hypothetical protein n=1 Tax=Pseudomonas aeruginosa TaxID=287 RepID=UPI0021E77564|nr:hypothetical protein [Pseudomonas aeruginosa]MCV3851671.1 hypothetical protein [Pseudomonas aeruginosa]MCV3857702.1 hypothetical protein [Pseudomonas aeruginosa]